MNEVQLGIAGTELDLCGIEPEDAEHLGQGGSGEDQVGDGQHAEQVRHGHVEARLHPQHEQDGEVPQDSDDVHGTERDGDPDMGILQPWDPQQDEGGGVGKDSPVGVQQGVRSSLRVSGIYCVFSPLETILLIGTQTLALTVSGQMPAWKDEVNIRRDEVGVKIRY